MAVCTKCGKEMKGAVKFCTACGAGAGMHDAKKARVLEGGKKSSKTAFIVAVAVVAVVVGWMAYSPTSRARSMDRPMMGGKANREGNKNVQYSPLKAENGEVKVPISALAVGAADYYVFQANGKDIKFFVLKASDGTVRVALDACNACYHAKLGYRHEGETMVCNNCGMSFKSSDIGKVSGGCNPVPLQNTQDGKTLAVKAGDLEAGVKYF
jgi:uncharacterized membrane protein